MKRFSYTILIVLQALMLSACVRPVTMPSGTRPGGPGPEVRVGLMVDTTSVDVMAEGGLDLFDPESGRALSTGISGPVTITASSDRLQSSTADITGSQGIVLRPRDGGAITIGGKPYRGEALVRSTGSQRLTAINRVRMEDYLAGVVPLEIGKVGEELFEAARAQAVAARTYAVRYLGRREALGFDVYATVQDQVYGGLAAEHEPVSRAVRETAGQILVFEDEPVEAFYHSTCAGVTASIHEVWPVEPPRHYLVSVSDINPDTGEAYCRSSNRFNWTQSWTVTEFVSGLQQALADSVGVADSLGTLRDVRVLERTPTGRIGALAIITTSDSLVYGRDRIRWLFRTQRGAILNSSKFDVHIRRNIDGEPQDVVATGGGWGHGIGMCQVGAMGRARGGQDYRTILQAYYTGATIRQMY